jgi:hypothetical protein
MTAATNHLAGRWRMLYPQELTYEFFAGHLAESSSPGLATIVG